MRLRMRELLSMSARRSDALRARDVVQAINEAQERIRVFAITRDEFLQGSSIEARTLADSLMMCVLRATEEAGKLSDRAKSQHPEIEWEGVSGMRNYLVHDYGNVDRALVWTAVNEELPGLAKACKQIMDESE